MTKIYIIRHAEAEGNLYRRVQGHHDGKITGRGYRQIAALAERFRDIHVDALYASDLSRTQTTATAITKYHDLPIQVEPRLKEVCMGVWENRTWGDIGREDPEQLAAFSSDPDNWHVSGSESFRHLGDRMLEVVQELGEKHEGQTIVLVSHGMAIRSLHCRVLGVPSRDVESIPHGDNTCVSLYIWDRGALTPEFRNDNSHLDETNSTFAHQTWWKKRTGMDNNNLRFERLDLNKESDYYTGCYADAWKTVHGTLRGFDGAVYLSNAKRRASEPDCLVKVISGDRAIGIVELDMLRGKKEGYGWISLFYLDGEHRNLGFGAQLLGYAVTAARERGFGALRLHAADCNEHAAQFYRHYGFREIGRDMGVLGMLVQMEMILD
ncbi:MAG: GNAT family N-acetyltransferase [Candidatus Heteroscillospira sp.]|jgi:probable phosphoglycerate mutase